MAIRGTIKVGDEVTHPDWDGDTRKVIEVFAMAWDPRGTPANEVPEDRLPIVCRLDRPAFDKGYVPTSEAEKALYDRWMEAGLEVVDAGN